MTQVAHDAVQKALNEKRARESKGRLISPDELHNAAKAHYLEGRDPVTENDWKYCVNFWGWNIERGLEEPICKLLAKIYDCPLSDEQIAEIALFQMEKK